MAKLGVSIINYNTLELMRECLTILTRNYEKDELEIWVLDNNSPDGSGFIIEKEFKSKINFVKSDTNLGFAKGQNMLLKKINSPLVLILNPDTRFKKSDIEEMVDFMNNNPKVGLASCKILGFDGRRHSNGGDYPFGLSLLSWLFNLESLGIKKNFHRVDEKYYLEDKEVDWVGGTFMFVRKCVFDRVGLFDEDFFMYFEDVDFCLRAKKAGYKIMLNSKVEIEHLSGASTKSPKFYQWSSELKNLILFYKKQFGGLAAFCLKVVVIFGILARMLFGLVSGNIKLSQTYGKILFSI